jgi:DNA-binding NarL/FixJ family response regulator
MKPNNPIRIVLAMPQQLDCAALDVLFVQSPDFCVVGQATRPAVANAEICKHRPDVLLMGSGFPSACERELCESVLKSGHVSILAYLDDHFAIARAARLLWLDRHRYLTRRQSFDEIKAELISAVAAAAQGRARVDHIVAESLLRTHDSMGFLALSDRERDVFSLLAQGQSVREIAQTLGVCQSTADNHKSSMMRKLRVHKLSSVVRLAIHAGVISIADLEAQSPRKHPSQSTKQNSVPA